jgi:dolichol-phosphate mannosyltransferase
MSRGLIMSLTATPLESPRVLVVMPTYNEADNINKIVPAVLDAAPVEILIVDDSSPDGTGALADALAAQEPRVHVLHRTSKDGLGRAYLAGFAWGIARGFDVLIEMDADFSHQPASLAPMIRHMRDFDVVIGSRYVQGGQTQNWGLRRRLISRGGGLYARSVLGVQIQDLTSGFIAWRREVLEALDLSAVQASGYGFQIEMKYRAARAGARILETPITFPDRTHGESKMSANIFSEALSLVWKLRLGR